MPGQTRRAMGGYVPHRYPTGTYAAHRSAVAPRYGARAPVSSRVRYGATARGTRVTAGSPMHPTYGRIEHSSAMANVHAAHGSVPVMHAGAAHPIHVGAATTVSAHHDHRGMTIARQNRDGSQVVANVRRLPNGRRQVEGFKVMRDAKAGTQTRLYTDGRRITVGRGFVTRSAPGHLAVTTHANGLREAFLPNGKPAFRERFGTMRDRHGRMVRTLERTVYARVWRGRAFGFRGPVRQVFGVVRYRGAWIYPYYPWRAPEVFYDPFFHPFYRPFPVAAVCVECVSGDVDFAGPPEVYSEPSDVVADMQVADGFQDGMTDAQDEVPAAEGIDDPSVAPVPLGDAPPDPQTQELTAEVNQLQGEVDAERARNAELQAALDQPPADMPPPPPAAPKPKKAKVVVPPDVRAQMHKQVKEDIAQEKNGSPLSIADVIASAEAQDQIFQVSSMIDATDTAIGVECVLSTGDLIRFSQVPGENDETAQMKVATAKAGSCGAGVVVEVSIGDLQDMLNDFSQRLEANMKRAHDRIAQAVQTRKAERDDRAAFGADRG